MINKLLIGLSCLLFIVISGSSITSAATIHQTIEEDHYSIDNLSIEGIIADENTGQFYSNKTDEHSITINGEVWSDQPFTLEVKMQIKTFETSVVIPEVSQSKDKPSAFSLTVALDDIPMDSGATETIYLNIIDEQSNEQIINCGQLTIDTTVPQLTTKALEINYQETFNVKASEPGYLYLIQSTTYDSIDQQTTTAYECFQQLEALHDQGVIERYYIPTAGNHSINVNQDHGFLRYIFRDLSANLTTISSYSLYLNNETPKIIDYYVDEDKIHLIYDQLLTAQSLKSSDFYVSKENIMDKPSYYYIIDDATTIDYRFGYNDYENDPKGSSRFRLSHSPDIFTNNAGVDPIDGKTIDVENYDFSYPGEYTIEYQVQDDPTENLIEQRNFNEYKQWSNITDYTIIAHRRPIAQLNSDQKIFDGQYVIDLSTIAFDLDHMDLENKGIVEQELQWKRSGEQTWHSTAIPDTLDASNDYIIRYRVKDLEQAWSNYAVEIINGENDQYLSINSFTEPNYPTPIPITQPVQIFCDVYTNDTIAAIQLISPKGTIYDLNYNQTFESYVRYSLTYNIPQNLEDKNFHQYDLIVQTSNGLTDHDMIKINVQTPIDLSVNCQKQYTPGDEITFTATTSPYVKTVESHLFQESDYAIERKMTLTKEENNLKYWTLTYTLPDNFSSQNYKCSFLATTFNNQHQELTKTIEVSGVQLIDFTIEGKWNAHGPVFYALEKIKVTAEILGKVDAVVIDLKDGLGAMTYNDPFGNHYAYTDFFDEDLTFPLTLEMISPGIYVTEFNLPLVESSVDASGNSLRESYGVQLKVKHNNTTIITQEQSIDIKGNIYDHIHIQEKNY